jgi:transposase
MGLSHQTIKSHGKTVEKKPIIRCQTHYGRKPDECARNNYIYFDDLGNQVSSALRRVFGIVKNDDDALTAAMKKTTRSNDREKLLAEKSKIEKRLGTLAALIQKLYEDRVTEVLSGENYQAFVYGYQKEQETLTERLKALDGELNNTCDYEEGIKQLQACADAYAAQTELTAEMLNRLITRIEIGYPQRTEGKISQDIKIIYRFIHTTL